MQSSREWARRRALGLTCLTTLLALAGAPAAASAQGSGASGYKIIINSASSVSVVSRKELAGVYLKKTAKWRDGTLAVPVDLPEDAPARAGFSRDVLGKPTQAVKAYWNQQIFSGRSAPPAEKRSDADVVAFVRSTPGAVGYVSASTPTPGVKLLAVRS
jgi:ABC-type phosphate transport system substrate-binding protein